MTDLANLINTIIETHRERQDFLRIETATILRMRAVCRRYVSRDGMTLTALKTAADELYNALETDDHPAAAHLTIYLAKHIAARDSFHAMRHDAEKRLRKLAHQLPVWSWVETVHGFGDLGLAQIVAEAGNLENYANPAKLWKRFGLAVIGGGAQRRVTGDAALEHGYSPVRRSMMYVIGDSLLKKQNPYRALYLARKATEQAKVPDGTKMLWHRRAQRYAEKRLLRDLWRAWRNLPLDELAEAA